MTNKLKKLARARRTKTGMSYQAAVFALKQAARKSESATAPPHGGPGRTVGGSAAAAASGSGSDKASRNAPTRIVFASRPGGTGNSTIAALFSVALARAGHRVLAVDLDCCRPTLTDNLGLAERRQIPYSVVDLLRASQGRPKVLYHVIAEERSRLDLIPGTKNDGDLSSAVWDTCPAQDLEAPWRIRFAGLDRKLNDVENDYDFVVVDAPSSLPSGQGLACLVAAHVIISPLSLYDSRRFHGGVRDLLELHGLCSSAAKVYVLVNMYTGDVEDREALAVARKHWGDMILPRVIPETDEVRGGEDGEITSAPAAAEALEDMIRIAVRHRDAGPPQ